jgi:hypothetical protein
LEGTLVDLPAVRPLLALDLLGDAQLAGIKKTQRALDGVAEVALGLGADIGAILKGGGDEGLEAGVRHDVPDLLKDGRFVGA